jgi:hypothetical protein
VSPLTAGQSIQHAIQISRRLWSLWDMVDLYGLRICAIFENVNRLKEHLQRVSPPGANAPQFELNPQNGVSVENLIVLNAKSLAEDLDMQSTKYQLNTLFRISATNRPMNEFIDGLDQLLIRIQEDLRSKSFLFVPASMAEYYDRNDLFGDDVPKKFKGTGAEIRSAGNCLAAGEATACIFHLMRAMEKAVRSLGRRLGATITPKTTWRQITEQMDNKIKRMPEVNNKQKHKKNNWEQARINLHHVGSVWRNNTMHPAASYTQSQAVEVFSAVRVFMIGLTAL